MIEVEEGGLGALEEDVLSGVEGVVDDVDRVGDVGLEAGQGLGQHLVGQLVGIDGEPVEDLGEHLVGVAQRAVQLLAEDVLVEEILHPDAEPHRLVGVGRADAALGRAELRLAEMTLVKGVELLVVREDQVGVARHLEAGAVDAPPLQHLLLLEKHERVDDHAVADDRHDVVVEHPARDELDRELLTVDDDGVSRVVAALIADDHRHFLGEEVGELALPLVSPLRSDDDRCWHVGQAYRRRTAHSTEMISSPSCWVSTRTLPPSIS